MSVGLVSKSADDEWLDAIEILFKHGGLISPRGQMTVDLWHLTTQVIMDYPIVSNQGRRLVMPFSCAEAHWILSGSNRLADIVGHAPQYEKFSDDGLTLRRAYGPPVIDQLGYVVDALINDECTRQAVLTIWRPRPGGSKDIPCTVAMQFRILGKKLFASVFMRSSDMWLGWVNDIFSFTCIAQMVALHYKYRTGLILPLGHLSVTAGSGHIYQKDLQKVNGCVPAPRTNIKIDWTLHQVPEDLMLDLFAVSAGVSNGGPIGMAFQKLKEFRKEQQDYDPSVHYAPESLPAESDNI